MTSMQVDEPGAGQKRGRSEPGEGPVKQARRAAPGPASRIFFEDPTARQNVDWSRFTTECTETRPGYCDAVFRPALSTINDTNIPKTLLQLTDLYNIERSLGGGKSGALVFAVTPKRAPPRACGPTPGEAARARQAYEEAPGDTSPDEFEAALLKASQAGACPDRAQCSGRLTRESGGLYDLGGETVTPEFSCNPTKILKIYLDAYDVFGEPRNERPFREVYSQCMMNGLGGFNCTAAFGKAPWPTSTAIVPPSDIPDPHAPTVLYMVTALSPGVALMDLDIGKLSPAQLYGLMAQMYVVWQEMQLRLGADHFSHWDFHPDNIFVDFSTSPRAPVTFPGLGLVEYPTVTLIDFDLVTCDAFPTMLPEHRAKKGSILGITERAMQWVFKWLSPGAAAQLLGVVIAERVLGHRILSKLPVVNIFVPELNPDTYHLLVYFVVFFGYAQRVQYPEGWLDFFIGAAVGQLPAVGSYLFVRLAAHTLLGHAFDSYSLLQAIYTGMLMPWHTVAQQAAQNLASGVTLGLASSLPSMWDLFVASGSQALSRLVCSGGNARLPLQAVTSELMGGFLETLGGAREVALARISDSLTEVLSTQLDSLGPYLKTQIVASLNAWISIPAPTRPMNLSSVPGVEEFRQRVGHYPSVDNLNLNVNLDFPGLGPYVISSFQLGDASGPRIYAELDTRQPLGAVVYTAALAPVVHLGMRGFSVMISLEDIMKLVAQVRGNFITKGLAAATTFWNRMRGFGDNASPTRPTSQPTSLADQLAGQGRWWRIRCEGVDYRPTEGDLVVRASVEAVGVASFEQGSREEDDRLLSALTWLLNYLFFVINKKEVVAGFHVINMEHQRTGSVLNLTATLQQYGTPNPCAKALGGLFGILHFKDVLDCTSWLQTLLQSLAEAGPASSQPTSSEPNILREELSALYRFVSQEARLSINAGLFTLGRAKMVVPVVTLPLVTSEPVVEWLTAISECYSSSTRK